MEKSSSEILTVEEAAEMLKIPRSSVYKLAQEGKIPAKKIGRHWRFHRATLLQWVADGGGISQANFEGKKSDAGSLDFS